MMAMWMQMATMMATQMQNVTQTRLVRQWQMWMAMRTVTVTVTVKGMRMGMGMQNLTRKLMATVRQILMGKQMGVLKIHVTGACTVRTRSVAHRSIPDASVRFSGRLRMPPKI